MKRYVHWLKIDGYAKDTKKQIEQIKNYLKANEISKCTLFFPSSGSFDKYVRLECNQCYNDLDLDVNSFSTNLRRLERKPRDIYESEKNFEELYMKQAIG